MLKCISCKSYIINIFGCQHSVIRWYLQGTQKGDIVDLPATEKQVKVSGLTIYSFSNGKITGHWQVVDRLGFMQQVGPQKPEARSQKPEARSQKPEARSQKPEARSQKLANRAKSLK